jgi:hypothetical protein
MGRHLFCKQALAGSIPAESTTFRRPAEGLQTGASEALRRWFDSTRADHAAA